MNDNPRSQEVEKTNGSETPSTTSPASAAALDFGSLAALFEGNDLAGRARRIAAVTLRIPSVVDATLFHRSAAGVEMRYTESAASVPDDTLDGDTRSRVIEPLRNVGDGEWWIEAHCSGTDASRMVTSELRSFALIAAAALRSAIAVREAESVAAKFEAILEQIPEAVTIFDRRGRVELTNEVAFRDASFLQMPPEQRLEAYDYRTADGRRLTVDELPSMRAQRGETIDADYQLRDPRTLENRFIRFHAAPIYDASAELTGSVVVTHDVTGERLSAKREENRRRRAEFLAGLGIDVLGEPADHDELDGFAQRFSRFLDVDVFIFQYRPASDTLELEGMGTLDESSETLGVHLRERPFRTGEGLPGTVFQIGRTLFFAEDGGNAIESFARDEQERRLIAGRSWRSIIATPVEAYGERFGVLVVSSGLRTFDGEDLDFVKLSAERLGAILHIRRLMRLAQEGQRAAEDLARREVDARARLEAVLESAPVGIAVISSDELRFEMANPLFVSYAEKLGRISPETKLVGLRVKEVVPDFEAPLQGVAEEGTLRIDQSVPMRLGGQLHHFNSIISPVRGRFSGTTQSLTVLVQDVTDQVRAKHEIEALVRLMEERSARLDSIYRSMTDALWVLDARGDLVDVNPAALTMFELGSRGEAAEKVRLSELTLRYPDGRPIPTHDLPQMRALRGETVPDYLAVATSLISKREIDLSIALAPIESNEIVGAVLVMRDISALQELDRKKDEFLSVASHELRTPLTTIKGYSQLLATIGNDIAPEERSNYLRAVLSEIERMMGLISELLDVSRIRTKRLQLHKRPVSWLKFLEAQTSAVRVQHPNREIIFNRGIEETVLDIDPDRLRQVIDNLVSNALKYSPEDSAVAIEVSREDDMIVTSVVDRGIGIPQDEIEHLFERFHRARNVSSRYYGGLGLGLYIAKAIVEAHHGTIDVKSSEGVGSAFTIRLPARK